MSMSSIQEKLNRLIIPEALIVGRVLDNNEKEILATSQLVLANYIQLYEYTGREKSDFYMLVVSSSALREALKSISLKLEELIQNNHVDIDNDDLYLASTLLGYDNTRFYELHDSKLGSDLMFLFIPKDKITEGGADNPVYLSNFGSFALETMDLSFRLYVAEDFRRNLTEDDNAIPAFLDDIKHGMKLFVVGAVMLENTVEGTSAMASLKPAVVMNSSLGDVLVLTPRIGSGGAISTDGSLVQYTFELDIPFDYRLAGAPVLTENGEFAGILTGIASDKGNMQGLTARFFLENLMELFQNIRVKPIDEWEPYSEVLEVLGSADYEVETEDNSADEAPKGSLDNFILTLEGNEDVEENEKSDKVSAKVEPPEIFTDEGRLIGKMGDCIYLAGVKEGNINDIAEESVLPIYTEVNNNVVGNGTGFIYKQKLCEREKLTELYIITNVHVIRPILKLAQMGSARILVNIDGKNVPVSEAIARKGAFLYFDIYHEFTPYDFCILKVKLETDKRFRFFSISEKFKIKPPEEVIAIGYPLHVGFATGLTLTRGSVSHVYDDNNPNPVLKNTLQIDVAINPGNSGGPLVTNELEVVGINTRGLPFTPDGTPIQGMNMAIRIDHVIKTFKNKRNLEVINLDAISKVMSNASASYVI